MCRISLGLSEGGKDGLDRILNFVGLFVVQTSFELFFEG